MEKAPTINCIHRPLCPNECPCDYFVSVKDTDYTTLTPAFNGNAIVYAHCDNCERPVRYPTEWPYVFCPYCGRKIKY